MESKEVYTPFGALLGPARACGKFGATEVVFLLRHGQHHTINTPSEINYRANIWALKSVGVTQILSVSAVGSLSKDIPPGDLAMPDQYFDFTKGKRAASFFGDGVVGHISTAKPVCPSLVKQISTVAKAQNIKMHSGNLTYACVEGPRLGTKAESFFLKNNGCQIVGMTNVPEGFLAREAQLCYATIAVSTDFDCWLEDPNEHASLDKILALYKQTLGKVKSILGAYFAEAPRTELPCECRKALSGAIVTEEKYMSEEKARIVAFLKH